MFHKRNVQFTPEKSAARLHILQVHCTSEDQPTLFIAGPDGAVSGEEDPTSQSVARYLFQGDYSRKLYNTVIDDEQLEDMFLCLSADKVELYRPPTFVPGSRKLTSSWPSTTQMKPPRNMIGDSFQCEEFKIRTFLDIVKGREALGFTQSAEAIERWPLVQAHALEEFKMGGFLTQKHQVNNVVEKVAKALAYVDAHSIDCLLGTNVGMLQFHWKTMMLTLDKPKTPWRRLEFSETDLVEPLASFYSFGNVQSSDWNDAAESKTSKDGASSFNGFRGARVLLGERTSGTENISRNHAQVSNTGADGRPAVHFTVEGEDAVTGIRCARTYLLTSIDHAVLPSISDAEEEEEDAEGEEEVKQDISVDSMDDDQRAAHFNAMDRAFAATIVQLYGHVKRGMDRMRTKSIKTADMCQTFLQNMIGKDLSSTLAGCDEEMIVEVCAFDANGQPNKTSVTGRQLRYVKVTVGLGNGRGALVLGDTWCVGNTSITSFNMTECIPYLRSWVCSRTEGDSVVELKRQVARSTMESALGNMYHDSELRRAVIVFGDSVANSDTFVPCIENASVRLFNGGVYIAHNGEGAVCYLFGSDISKVRLLESDEAISMLAFTLTNTAPVLGAVNHYVSNRTLVGEREMGIELPRGSSLLEQARDAYARWTRTPDMDNVHDDQSSGVTESPMSLGMIECSRISTDSNGGEVYGTLRNAYNTSLPTAWDNKCIEYVNQCLEADVHMTPDSLLVTEESSSTTTSWSTVEATKSSIPLILIGGVPGSGKNQFASVLTDRTRDEYQWSTIGNDDMSMMDSRNILASLRDAASVIAEEEKQGTMSERPRRVLYVLPGACTVSDAINLIGKDIDVAAMFHITATVGCVNVPLSYASSSPEDVQLLPGITEQIRKGWTTHIVVFGAHGRNDVSKAIQERLMEVNSDANMIIAQGMTLSKASTDEESAAPSPGGSSSGDHANASVTIRGCSSLSDLLIPRDTLVNVAANDIFGTQVFVEGRRFQTVSTTTASVWQHLSTSLYGCLHRDRYILGLSALTTKNSNQKSTDAVGEATQEQEQSLMETPKKNTKKKKSSFMGRLQSAAKAKVNGVDLTKGGLDAVHMPNSTVNSETWYVTSRVMFCEHPGVWYQCRASNGHVWCQEEDAPLLNSNDVKSMEFLFVGPQVDTYVTSGQRTNYKRAINDMVSSCAPPLPSKKTQRTRRMLKKEEIDAVDISHREMNAGDGWYFDGRSYVGPLGDSRQQHPKLEEFLVDYLVEQNNAVETYNNQVQARRTRSELARKGESTENMDDMVIYAEEEAQRMNGDVSIVSVGFVSGIVSPAMKIKRNNVMFESKEMDTTLPMHGKK
jgi:hypothetical protein